MGTSVEITANKVWWTGTKKREREKRMKSCWLLKVISLKSFFLPSSYIYPPQNIHKYYWVVYVYRKFAVYTKRSLTRTIRSAHWIQIGQLILCHRFAWINNCKVQNCILYFVKLPWPIWVFNSEAKFIYTSFWVFIYLPSNGLYILNVKILPQN